MNKATYQCGVVVIAGTIFLESLHGTGMPHIEYDQPAPQVRAPQAMYTTSSSYSLSFIKAL